MGVDGRGCFWGGFGNGSYGADGSYVLLQRVKRATIATLKRETLKRETLKRATVETCNDCNAETCNVQR